MNELSKQCDTKTRVILTTLIQHIMLTTHTYIHTYIHTELTDTHTDRQTNNVV